MWCDFLCGVMRCHVTCSYVIRLHLLWSDVTQEDGMLWACDAMWLVVRSYCIILCDSKRLCDVVGWKLMCCKLYGERMSQYYDPVLQSTTPYYKVLYSVLRSTTNYYSALVRTTVTKYDCNVPICLMVATHWHETSGTLSGATYRMQKTMELRHSWSIVATHEIVQHSARRNRVTLQHQQRLRLPGNSRLEPKIRELIPPIERRCEDNPRLIQARLIQAWSDHEQTFRIPTNSQNFTKCCPCHDHWHSNFTKYCACHEKSISSHMKRPVQWAEQREPLLNITNIREIFWKAMRRWLSDAPFLAFKSQRMENCSRNSIWEKLIKHIKRYHTIVSHGFLIVLLVCNAWNFSFKIVGSLKFIGAAWRLSNHCLLSDVGRGAYRQLHADELGFGARQHRWWRG